MNDPAPAAQSGVGRYTATRYLELAATGALAPDDRVELLEGVIVATSPQQPRHATGVQSVLDVLHVAVGPRAVVRVQLPLVVGSHSVPEPDVAVVPGRRDDYWTQHPTTALLIVEVADATLVQDRLTKAGMYAAAGIPEYWIVNLVDDRLEVSRVPLPAERRYAEHRIATREDRLALVALPDVAVDVAALLPPRSA